MRDVATARQKRLTSYGFTLAGDPRMVSDQWEVAERAIFVSLLDTTDVVIDVGANIGFYSCLAAMMGKRVIAIEPSHRNLQLLKRNLWDNHLTDVELLPVALANSCGLAQIYGFGGIASLVKGWAHADAHHAELIPVTTLDTILAGRFAKEKLLIKIDVEGFELELLQGAVESLRREPRPTWIIEILSRDDVVPGGTNLRFVQTFEYLWEAGYECKLLDGTFETVTPDHLAGRLAEGAEMGANYLFRSAPDTSK